MLGYAPDGTAGDEGEGPDGEDVARNDDAFHGRRQKGPGFISWSRIDGPDASTFNHVFTATDDVCTEMDGIGSGGDSNGSLYKMNSGHPRPSFAASSPGDGSDNQDSENGVAWSNYHTAALDDPTHIGWMTVVGLRDVDGSLDDTYEPRGNDDSDGDGIADLWDNCDNDANFHQLYQNNDPDLNGRSNECETCVGSDNFGHLDNANWEVEWALGAPELRDACEPMPVPRCASAAGTRKMF